MNDPLDTEKTMMNLDDSLGDMPTMRPDGKSIGRVDRYELIEKLGEGGFGAVYGARDTEAGILVALKALPAEISRDAEEMAEIRDNFALVSRLHHPNVASVLHLHKVESADERAQSALGVREDDYLTVMEYVPGATLYALRNAFPNQQVEFHQAVQICTSIADALDYAHSQKILHRDVKPKNVMVAQGATEALGTGQEALGNSSEASVPFVVKVLDFGLAAEIRSSMSRRSNEADHSKSGTPAYMAPEQWAGRRQGPAADQYALAVLLYELLSGSVPFRPVFESDNFEVMRNAVCHEAVPALKSLSRKQNAVLRKALAKEPKERYGSCSEFMKAFAGENVKPKKVTTRRKAGRFVLSLLLAAGLGTGGYYFWNNEQYDARKVKVEAEDAFRKLERDIQNHEQGFDGRIDEVSRKLRFAEDAYQGANWLEAGPAYEDVLKECAAVRTLDADRRYAITQRSAVNAKKSELAAAGTEELVPEKYAEAAGTEQLAVEAFGAGRFSEAAGLWEDASGAFSLVQKDGEETAQYLAAQSRWDAVITSLRNDENQPEGTIGLDDILQYARVQWDQANEEARSAADADSPADGSVLYERAWANYQAALETTEAFVRPQVEVIITPADAQVEIMDDETSVSAVSAEGEDGAAKRVYRLEQGRAYTMKVSRDGYQIHTETVTADWRGVVTKEVQLSQWDVPEVKKAWHADLGGGVSMEFAPIPSGSFMMGSTTGDLDEMPVHEVRITAPFWMARTETTVRHWQQFLQETGHVEGTDLTAVSCPIKKEGNDYVLSGEKLGADWEQPMCEIDWNAAMKFAEWLTEKERRAGRLSERFIYSLPTEAQWEYACRAGETGGLIKDLKNRAWYKMNSGETTHPVGRKNPNPWGLYDMYGNVWEWCLDSCDWKERVITDTYQDGAQNPLGTSGSLRIRRGGSWGDNQFQCTPSNRYVMRPTDKFNCVGVRLVLVPARKD